MNNHLWNGPIEAIAAAIAGQPNVIGLVLLSDVAYVPVITNEDLALPEG
jgi:hypothetical protein